MHKIRFASSNPEKILEVSQILGKKGIEVVPIKTDLKEIRSENQLEVAIEKAKTAFAIVKRPVIAEDTGVYFDAYENFPGAFPSFVFRELGYDGILRLLEGKNRKAHFKTIVAYFDGKTLKTFIGICAGRITGIPDEKKYQNIKLPYEAIFIPDGRKLRLSRTNKTEKHKFSHRSIAVGKFAEWFLGIKSRR
ncbi:non-canonical purine NTP pyrophosphatase [Candidatus Micrarchaeota archaeon]|nr:non-canonical purine NTP pyrophosphatase [Candidatus Micrarchaeota archaeon]